MTRLHLMIMQLLPSIMLFGALASAYPQQNPSFCSKVSQRHCNAAGTSFCQSYLHLSTVTSTPTVPQTGVVTKYSTTRTVYTFAPDYTCYVKHGNPRRATAAPIADLVVEKRAVITPAEAALALKKRARPATPTCLSGVKSSATLSSICSCLATANPTTTITKKGAKSTVTTASYTVSKANSFYVIGPSNLPAQNGNFDESYTPFYGIGTAYSLADHTLTDGTTQSCAIKNEYGYWGYTVADRDGLSRFMTTETAFNNSQGYTNHPITCRIEQGTFLVKCSSADGSNNYEVTAANGDPVWALNNDGTDDFQATATPVG